MKNTLGQRKVQELVDCLSHRLNAEDISIKNVLTQITERTFLESFLEQKSRMNYGVFTHFGSVNVIKKIFLVKLEYEYLVFGLTAGDEDDSSYTLLKELIKEKSIIAKDTIKSNCGFFVLLGSIE